MTAAHFEDHPTDPDKVILRKPPRIDQGPDYERGFVDGMQYQMQSSVDRAVNRMAQPEQEPERYTGGNGTAGREADVRPTGFFFQMPSHRTWVGLMRGVRVEGDTVVISVKGGNEAARELCGALIEEMSK